MVGRPFLDHVWSVFVYTGSSGVLYVDITCRSTVHPRDLYMTAEMTAHQIGVFLENYVALIDANIVGGDCSILDKSFPGF